MAETLAQVFWFAVTAWTWIVLAILALGSVIALCLPSRWIMPSNNTYKDNPHHDS